MSYGIAEPQFLILTLVSVTFVTLLRWKPKDDCGKHSIRLPPSPPDIVKLDTFLMSINPLFSSTLISPFNMIILFELMISCNCQKLSGEIWHISLSHTD